jgi:hypothetical protein
LRTNLSIILQTYIEMWEKPRRCWQKIPRGNMKPKIEEQTMDKRTNNDLHNATHKTRD